MKRTRKRQPLPWNTIGRWAAMLAASTGLGVILFALYSGVCRVMASSYFEVREIRWIGLQHRDAARMNLFFQDVLGRNLFQVDVAHIQRRILADPWIEQGAVKKLFPNRLLFVISEHTPAAVAVDDPYHAVLLSATGRVLELGGDYPPDLPRVIHLRREGLPILRLALQWTTLLSDHPDAVMDLANPQDLVIHLNPQWALHVGGTSEVASEAGHVEASMTQQWRRFLEVKGRLLQAASQPLEIDLRFPGKVIVQAREAEFL